MGRDDETRGDHIHGVVSGTVSGPVAIGKDIRQRQQTGDVDVKVTEAELGELRQAFADLRRQVAEAAPAEEREKAVEMVDEMERDTIADEPKPITIRYVRDWLLENVPDAAGAVLSIVVHPIVGKLVSAAGDRVVAEFQQLLGGKG